ncbi:hypothetical protein BLNAU_2793 [Blattamonas nauphoetae]|uniref:Uncharacterized protein n=1 Tax=Blattamonas nauphoetae TaxID=2049346 RepID=A0ABQ9YEC8_9EUKA|nr:hypothetical protein BLNAU_2793 [Blattamonas nauphoetae]
MSSHRKQDNLFAELPEEEDKQSKGSRSRTPAASKAGPSPKRAQKSSSRSKSPKEKSGKKDKKSTSKLNKNEKPPKKSHACLIGFAICALATTAVCAHFYPEIKEFVLQHIPKKE